jgi:hypothetical protein|tara:strand:- start:68 stop:385 length:318 start_codon:yes stop_codon:yes gene_type:complete
MAIKAIIKVYRYFLQRRESVWSKTFHFFLNHLLDRTLLIKVLTSVVSASLLDNLLHEVSVGGLFHILDELFSWRKITTISATLWTFSLDSCIVLKIKLQVNEIIN